MTQELSKEPLNEIVLADLDTMTATKETLEDYTLRFAPRSYRKWSTRVVGISALGHRLSRRLRDRRQCRYLVWHHQCVVGHLDLRRWHFPDGLPRRP